MTQPRITSFAIVALLLALAISAQFHRAETHARTQANEREATLRLIADRAHDQALAQTDQRLMALSIRITAVEGALPVKPYVVQTPRPVPVFPRGRAIGR